MNKKLQNCGREQLFLFFEPVVDVGEPSPSLAHPLSPLDGKRSRLSPVESMAPNSYISESQLSAGQLDLERMGSCHLELQFVADKPSETNGGESFLVRSLSPLARFSPNSTSISR